MKNRNGAPRWQDFRKSRASPSVDSATRTLRVRRGHVRPAAPHAAGERVAALVSFWKKQARPEYARAVIVVVLCDTGERYLSTWLFESEV